MDYSMIPVAEIKVNKGQPRKNFDRERLKQLADSIKEVGQLQPVIVQKTEEGYHLIVGERRLRAMREENDAEKIAAIIIEGQLDDYQIDQIQLIENLQRQDLNPLERAKFIDHFIEENQLTKKEASQKLGIPRTTLTEWLNILEVKPLYREAVLNEDSTMSLSHITLARGLTARTGDPTKLDRLLAGVMKYNLSRDETRYVVELFNKHLHIDMEEAFKAVLIRREREKFSENFGKEQTGSKNYFRKLLGSLNRTGKNLEDLINAINSLDESQQEQLLDEFLYIYQMIKIMVPELGERQIESLIDRLKEK